MGDKPTPNVKLPRSHEYAQLLSCFALEYSFKVFNCRCDEHAIYYEYIEQDVNLQHHQSTIDVSFRSV